MALNIKNPVVEALATEVAAMTGETKTETIRRALEERKQRLAFRLVEADRARRLRALLEDEVWPAVHQDQLGRRLGKEEEETILGLGGDGA
jgi:antitoxin VapB